MGLFKKSPKKSPTKPSTEPISTNSSQATIHSQYNGKNTVPQNTPLDPRIIQYFQMVDKDKSGKIDSNELFEALRYSQYQYYAYETVNMLMSLFDLDGNCTIDIHEFQQLWNYLGEWQMLFQTFDMDRTGTINVYELKQAMYAFGYRISDPLLECLVAKFSVGGSNSLNFDQFVRICVLTRKLSDEFIRRDADHDGYIQLSHEDLLLIVFNL